MGAQNRTRENRWGAASNDASPSLTKRLGWLALIWTVSVLTLSGVAWLMRLFMNAIGLQTA